MTFYNPTYTFVANTLAQAGQVNANFAGVSAVLNGNIDTTNIAIAAGIKNTQCAACDSQFTMGGASGARPLPTSGALTGEYWHNGNWTQTGAITSSGGVRVHVNGSMTFGAFSWTAATECSGGNIGTSTTTATGMASRGSGIAAGDGGALDLVSSTGGGGGGFGGGGGKGATGFGAISKNNAGGIYSIAQNLSGSGGGGGDSNNSVAGGGGGGGGGSIYIECTGAIILPTGASITANGAAGGTSTAGAGGGGSGGGIQIRCLSTILVSTGASITASGGGGGNGGSGGGGGGGGVIDLSGTFITNNGTISAGGGAAGTGGAQAAVAGATGIVNLNQFVQNVRSAG
jgi:hypothetical protein